ncbi:MAG: aldo/keto reductase [Lentisphaeria bacterium]|nr:aldo/keto reductase [Lentisphaeria bacterium]
MQHNDFRGESLSRLGFGMMRLPTQADGKIDEAAVFEMVDYALAHGVNYFDTAFPYHSGWSEMVTGAALARHPRESFNLATKFPGHQVSPTHYPQEIFEKQLKKCQVEYFDYYLLHNIYENSYDTYMDPKWGIVEYFAEQRRKGRIRHLGFSCHARPDMLERFLNEVGTEMEFCQIQLNYLDWTLQEGKRKYDLLTERGIPVWVMEPVRGGKLAKLTPGMMSRLEALRPGCSAPGWSFRWLMGLSNVKMILSGMSNMEQMKDNVATFSSGEPLSEAERQLLLEIAEALKVSVPCTACRYCCEGCPAQLDIPYLISFYNDICFQGSMTVGMQLDALPVDKLPSACLQCGACAAACPQKIDIPTVMRDFTERLKSVPKWADVCRKRDAEQPKI